MKNKFWTSEKLLSLSALFVSLCTLIVFVYQTDLIRTQQYMSVYPHLNLYNSASGTMEYKYVLENKGIGPALIREVKVVELGGEAYETLADYVHEYLEEEDSVFFAESWISEGRLIPKNEKIELIRLIPPEYLEPYGVENTLEGAFKLREIINSDSLRIEITYESVYGESWTLRNGGEPPAKN